MAKLCSAASFWSAILPSLIDAWRNAPVLEKTSNFPGQALVVGELLDCFALQSVWDIDAEYLYAKTVSSTTRSVSRRARDINQGFLNIISSYNAEEQNNPAIRRGR